MSIQQQEHTQALRQALRDIEVLAIEELKRLNVEWNDTYPQDRGGVKHDIARWESVRSKTCAALALESKLAESIQKDRRVEDFQQYRYDTIALAAGLAKDAPCLDIIDALRDQGADAERKAIIESVESRRGCVEWCYGDDKRDEVFDTCLNVIRSRG